MGIAVLKHLPSNGTCLLIIVLIRDLHNLNMCSEAFDICPIVRKIPFHSEVFSPRFSESSEQLVCAAHSSLRQKPSSYFADVKKKEKFCPICTSKAIYCA